MPTNAGVPRKALSRVKDSLRAAEDWWFDTRWGVETLGDPHFRQVSDIVGVQRDGNVYAPARVRNVEMALNLLPIPDPSSYTFLDLGSGKGRVVLLAARRPFLRVVGVEYSEGLHRQAEINLKNFKGGEAARARVELVLGDAATYAFPAGNLVLHLFNPFGPEVMSCVLENLQNAIREQPRKVFIVMLWPELSDMVGSSPFMKLYHRDRRCEIFVTEP